MTPTPVTVRVASLEDAPILADVGARTFRATYAADNPPGLVDDHVQRSFSPAIQAAELADPTVIYMVAEQDGDVAGYAMLAVVPPPDVVRGAAPVQLSRLYVDDGAQGRGVGRALMDRVLFEAAARGHDLLWLTVWSRNHRARAVYDLWGFVDVGATVFEMAGDQQTDRVLVHPVTPPR